MQAVRPAPARSRLADLPTDPTVQRWAARLVPWLLLGFAVAWNLVWLRPEVSISVPSVNDAILHKISLAEVIDALRRGGDPTDTWLPTITLGYPLFHHYQHLAYLPPALAYLALGGAVPLEAVYAWTLYLALSIFPLAIYASLRRLGFNTGTAALGGLLAPLVSTNGLYGLDFVSYVWRGYGVYTQLWGMLLMPLAVAWGYIALRDGRGWLPAVALVAATLVTHTVFGWITVLSVALGVVVAPGAGRFWTRGLRLGLLLGLTALAASYFLVPFVLDGAYMNRSIWEAPWKYDVYGAEWTLQQLVQGGLFDFNRPSTFSVLVAVGALICLLRWRDERYRLPLVLAVFWLLVYFGRPTWGALLNLLPMSRELHFHRVIAGFHLGGIWLAGIALGAAWTWLLARPRPLAYLLPVAALTVGLLVPMYQERASYLDWNGGLMQLNRDALDAEAADLEGLEATLRALPPGRIYAGRAATWGKDYRVADAAMYHLLNQQGFDMNGFLYHALSLNADVQVTFNDQRLEEYDLYNTRYVVAPVDQPLPDFLRPLARFGRHQLYEAPTSGYFELVAAPGALSGNKNGFYQGAAAWLASDWPARHLHPAVFLGGVRGNWPWEAPLAGMNVVLEQIAERPERANLPSPAAGRVLQERVERQGYAAEVQLDEPGLLMAKTAYHPYLRVRVDGQPVEPLMLMPAYVGIPLEAGTHSVTLHYEPPVLRPLLMLFGLALLAAIGVIEWRWRAVTAWLARRGLVARWHRLGERAERAWAWPPLAAIWARLCAAAPALGILGALALLTALPVFQLKLMQGHDTLVYLPRLVEFWEGLRAGMPFPRWAPDLAGGYGEPHFVFNPPLIYYLGLIFRALGTNFVTAQALLAIALLAAAALAMYLFAGAVLGRRGGLVAAVAYLMAPYFLVNLYVRHALADFAGFAALPIAFLGVWRLANGGGVGALALTAAGVAALLLASSPVSLMALPAVAALLVVLAVATRQGWLLVRGGAALALGLALSAFFWLPSLVERAYIHSERFYEGFLYYRDHALEPAQLLFSRWGYGFSLPGPGDGMSFAIGWAHLLLWLVALALVPWLWRRSRAVAALVGFCALLVPLAAMLTTNESLPLWDRLALLQGIVYPWRFLQLIAFATAFLCGVPLLLLRGADRLAANNLTVVLLVLVASLGLPFARPSGYLDTTDLDFLPSQISARWMYAGTGAVFEPAWVEERPASPASGRFTAVSGGGTITEAQLGPYRYQLGVQVGEPSRMQVNTYWYPGWTLRVDGVERPLSVTRPEGLMEFELRPGDARVELVFEDTPLRAWTARLSLAALLLLLALPLLAWLRRRRALGPAPAPAPRLGPREPVQSP